MKNKTKVLFVLFLGLFFMLGLSQNASALTVSDLTVEGAVNIQGYVNNPQGHMFVEDDLDVRGLFTMNLGQIINGTTDYRGTIFNSTADVTVGDNLRVDGTIWRNYGPVKIDDDLFVYDMATFDGNVIPALDLTYSLGIPSKRWKGVYAGDLIADNIVINGTDLSGGQADQVLTSDGSGGVYWSYPSSLGEANTASNVGVGGVGLFLQKSGLDLEFKNINAGSNKISVLNDAGNNEVDVDVNEENLTIGTDQISGGVVYDDLRVPLTTAKGGGVNDPTFGLFRDDGAGSQGAYSWLFPTNPASNREIFFTAQIPHSYIEGTDLAPHIHWTPTNSDTGVVRWGLEYTWQNVDGTFSNTVVTYVNDAADGTAYKQQIAPLPDIDGTGMNVSSMLVARVFRDTEDAADTYNDDAAALELDFHYQLDKLGTLVPFPSP